MDTNLHLPHQRPNLEDFSDPVSFVEAMLTFRKRTERGFSILKATTTLRRVSPALVSLVVARKRTLTPDRADEFAKLLALTAAERHFFKAWVNGETSASTQPAVNGAVVAAPMKRPNRKEVSTHILKDWLNPYVKDVFQFSEVQRDPSLAERILLHIASPKRVQSAVDFLMREGHLRKTLDGRVVLDTPLSVADAKVPNQKVRQFHKSALVIAQKAIDRVPAAERNAVTMTVALNEKNFKELFEMMEEFGARLRDFANELGEKAEGDTLYQFIMNASPIGGTPK